MGLVNNVVFTGWIPRSELYGLFERAAAFVAPSLFEGFGLPVVEALAAGIPVACSAIPVFDWLTAGAAALFDPLSVQGMAGALEQIAEDVEFRKRAATAGPKRARAFDWAVTAEQTLNVLIGALQARGSIAGTVRRQPST